MTSRQVPAYSLPAAGSPAPVPLTGDGRLSREHFGRICALLYRICGISLQPGKEQLVQARLWKRIGRLGLSGFGEYLQLVESDAGREELAAMVDALTTNKTSFFREPEHFDFLRSVLDQECPRGSRLRIWSAGCSTGQEPYSIAMTLLEKGREPLPWDARILATDLSSRVLEQARAGLYDEENLAGVPDAWRRRYFSPIRDGEETLFRVGEGARGLVRYARLNLLERWSMKGPFDLIFCRNVMIYFDKETQNRLVRRFCALLRPRGYLFIGHAESLTGRDLNLGYVLPAIYQKQQGDESCS